MPGGFNRPPLAIGAGGGRSSSSLGSRFSCSRSGIRARTRRCPAPTSIRGASSPRIASTTDPVSGANRLRSRSSLSSSRHRIARNSPSAVSVSSSVSVRVPPSWLFLGSGEPSSRLPHPVELGAVATIYWTRPETWPRLNYLGKWDAQRLTIGPTITANRPMPMTSQQPRLPKLRRFMPCVPQRPRPAPGSPVETGSNPRIARESPRLGQSGTAIQRITKTARPNHRTSACVTCGSPSLEDRGLAVVPTIRKIASGESTVAPADPCRSLASACAHGVHPARLYAGMYIRTKGSSVRPSTSKDS